MRALVSTLQKGSSDPQKSAALVSTVLKRGPATHKEAAAFVSMLYKGSSDPPKSAELVSKQGSSDPQKALRWSANKGPATHKRGCVGQHTVKGKGAG